MLKMSPISFKGDWSEETKEIVSNTYGCANCGTPIDYKITKSKYCLDCSIKYSKQIREKEK